MCDSLVSEIRDTRAESRAESRKLRWWSAIDGSRGLPTNEIKYSEQTVEDLARKVNSKGEITADDLSILMYALGESEKHVSKFFSTIGALPSLVRELTGNHAKKQLFAVGCLYNLSLGPERSCFSIAKSSGAYLITYLQSGNSDFVELCARTLGNLYASSEKVAQLLKNQGLFGHLIPLINNNQSIKVVNAAAYALGHILFTRWCLLSKPEIENIIRNAISSKYQSEQIYYLIYLLSSNDYSKEEFVTKSVMQWALMQLTTYFKMNVIYDLVIINCLIRILANACSKEALYANDTLEILNSEPFIEIVNYLLGTYRKDIIKDLLWFLGNIYCALEDKNQPFFARIAKTLNLSISKL